MKESYIFLLLALAVRLNESKFNSKIKVHIYNSVVTRNEWKDLKDVICVTYRRDSYYPVDILKTTNIKKFNKKSRLLILFLNCSYARDLKTLFFIFKEFENYCTSLIPEEGPIENGYDCAVVLFAILQKIPSLITLMKESLYVMEYLHNYPKEGGNKKPIFEHLFLNLEKLNNVLKSSHPIENNSLATKNFLKRIHFFFTFKYVEIDWDIDAYCQFEPLDRELLWQKWNEEYKKKVNNNILQFHDYLSERINLIVNSIVIEKFHKLGFQYNRNTLQIGLPFIVDINDLKFFTRPNKTLELETSEPQKKRN
ncbi:uncharacterized protein LOC126895112 isoform X2 [Daktulosphaira vitifoliae]|uniref:uncharacterized protein LOC126895112 isoform X2 n=1 Tax=Daktulosphaira vitifoliae TaxID=58002 RepID=UPI0021AA1265|nr:uncharacterized protein LOC126895112 isoform X2 [Daktulosphaira vitifoliae]